MLWVLRGQRPARTAMGTRRPSERTGLPSKVSLKGRPPTFRVRVEVFTVFALPVMQPFGPVRVRPPSGCPSVRRAWARCGASSALGVHAVAALSFGLRRNR